jgi:arylsulfatase A-like enzyme
MRYPFRKISWILLGLLVFGMGGCGDETVSSRPNVIVLVIDTLRADRLGIHGSERGLSPTMDGLGREGFAFYKAVAPSSWTKPSVASLLTGLYPGRHGAVLSPLKADVVGYEGLSVLAPSHVTLAERMKEAGYRTAAFVTNPHIIPAYYFDQGFDEFTQPAGKAELLLGKALDWIEQAGEQDGFFLYLHVIDPHTPYFPPEEYWEDYFIDPGINAPFVRQGDPGEIILWLKYFNEWNPEGPEDRFRFDYEEVIPQIKRMYPEKAKDLTPLQVASQVYLDFTGYDDPDLLRRKDCLVGLYEAEIAYSDDSLAAFLQALRQRGVLDDTVLIITGDHGEAFLEHRYWGHGVAVFGEEVNVPLIFHLPPSLGACQGGSDDPVSLVDLYPTVLDLAGLPVPEGIDGCSLRPMIEQGSTGRPAKGPVHSEAILNGGDFVSAEVRGKKLIRTQRIDGTVDWKYYDLDTDPLEADPLDPEMGADAARALRRSIETLRKGRTATFGDVPEELPLSEEELEQLQALGYF